MIKRTFITAMVVLCTMAAMAQGRHHHKGGQTANMDRPNTSLNLTEEQQSQFDEARVAHHKIVLPLQNELAEKKAALRTQTMSETPDQKLITKTIEAIGSIETSLLKERVAHQMKLRALLTDEQKLIFDQHHGRGENFGRRDFHGHRKG